MLEVICDYSFNTIIAFYMENNKVIKIDFDYPDPVGNIYYGTIINTLPNINAYFLNIGKDITVFVQNESINSNLPIQIIKTSQGKKCIRGTQNLFLTGRYIIYYPNETQTGAHIHCGDIPGLIILRPNAKDLCYQLIQKDAQSLYSIWQKIEQNKDKGLVYEDNNLINRILRDIKSGDKLILSSKKLFNIFSSSYLANEINIEIFNDKIQTILGYYNLYNILSRLNTQNIKLQNGGNIIFGLTDALIAVDVNSGNSNNSYYEINLQAAKAIVEQILLRNLSGLIIIDFLKLNSNQENDKLYSYIKLLFADDSAQTSVKQVNSLGLIEITRQYIGPSLYEIICTKCNCCFGTGRILSNKFAALDILYKIQNQLTSPSATNQINIQASKELAYYMLNYKKIAILELESKYKCKILFSTE